MFLECCSVPEGIVLNVQQSVIMLYAITSDVLSYNVHACGVQTEPKKKLTPEEAAQQAEELRKRISIPPAILQPLLAQCSSRPGLRSDCCDMLLKA